MPPTTHLLDPAATPDPLHTAIVALRTDLQSVVAESAAYRQEVEEYKDAQEAKDAKRDRQRKRENLVGALVAVAISVPIVIMLALLGQNLTIARNAERSAQEARKTADVIASCTTPTGACYQDAGKRQSGAVSTLVRYQEDIAWCAKATETRAALDTCVAELAATPSPSPPAR